VCVCVCVTLVYCGLTPKRVELIFRVRAIAENARVVSSADPDPLTKGDLAV